MSAQTITQAVILAAGLGTRMRRRAEGVQLTDEQERAAKAGTKALIDVGRPFLDHVITELADAGISRVCLVIGPSHQQIRDYYSTVPTERVTIDFAVQPEPLGTANALLAAEDWVDQERFLLINSDNFYPADAVSLLSSVPGPALVGFEREALTELGNIPPERSSAFAMLQVDEQGRLVGITEKPDAETAARLAGSPLSMNCWALPRTIFDQAHRVRLSARGEYELPDTVRLAISEGIEFTVLRAAAGVLDLSSQSDIASVVDLLAGHEVRL